ncbi:MAG: AmmeMemoRadiSam system protein A [Candidatus Sericytochromatia bacterium]|nr:AmmeMemoRadiSam system protein A [Candidatus Sericytochromatia bacterium]
MNTKTVFANSLPKLARLTIEEYISNNNSVVLSDECLTEYKNQRAGIFVTIYKNNQLRGCIGTISPTQENIISEILINSISACSRDPRFEKVKISELEQLTYSVNVLMPPEQIDSTDKLDPQNYGVIVVGSNNRRGLLLPRLESINTIQEQMYHVMVKANIKHDETIELYRFESIEHKE